MLFIFITVQVGGLFEIDPQNDLAIENLLSEVKSTDVNAVRKAKSFFDSCNNQTAINIAGEGMSLYR